MSLTKIKNFIFIIMTNLIILAFLFIILESAARIFYPEFKDNIHSKNLTMNKKKYEKEIYGYKHRVSKYIEDF